MEALRETVRQAELVLVGIGEELETGWQVLEQTSPYAEWMKLTDGRKELSWVKPYFMAHYLKHNRDEIRTNAYESLHKLLQGKNYFLISLCMDGRLLEQEWKEKRVVLPCGGYTRLQCSGCGTLIEADEQIDTVIEQCRTKEPSLWIEPVCSQCNETLVFNNITAQPYDENGYLPMWDIYTKWLQGTINRKICVIELGVGMRFPSVIRFPFEKIVMLNRKASFFRIHSKLYQLSEEISDRGVSIAKNPLFFLRN